MRGIITQLWGSHLLFADRVENRTAAPAPHVGSSNQNVLPSGARGSTPIVPPCASIASLQNANPSPVEWYLLSRRLSTVPNFSKIFFLSEGGTPGPSS